MLRSQVYSMKLSDTRKKLNGCVKEQYTYLLKTVTQKTLNTTDQSLVFQEPTNF